MRTEDYSPLVLAYLGDAVFELYVRERLVRKGNMPVKKFHVNAQKYVAAGAQANMYHRVIDDLTEEEKNILKRGRNAKTNTPRSASVGDYHHATGLEALFGYLYIKEEHERARWLFERCISEEWHEERKE